MNKAKAKKFYAGPRLEADLYETHELFDAAPSFSIEDDLAQTDFRIVALKNEVASSSNEDVEKVQQNLAELDAKKLALLEKQLTVVSEDHPRFVQAVKDWLTTELMSRGAQDPPQPIDDTMYAEAEILAEMIGELHEDKDSAQLEKIAETMKEIFLTESELVKLRGGKALADSPSEHLVSTS
jgi:hypothetical protein